MKFNGLWHSGYDPGDLRISSALKLYEFFLSVDTGLTAEVYFSNE